MQFPKAPFQTEDLADWLELRAIQSDDNDASAGELERELKRLGASGAEGLIARALTEIDRREVAAGSYAYPFTRQPNYIQLKKDAKSYPAYIFCLALSFCTWKVRKNAPENPWLLFEELAAFSAKNYLGGESILFGTSCRIGRSSESRFQQQASRLANVLREGEGFQQQKLFSCKDSKLDVVAWKPFPDLRASQVVLFGQCAAGKNWKEKLTELDPVGFWDQWMKRGKVSELLRSVFIPHRVFDEDEWELRARSARLLFDRCRVVNYAHRDTSSGVFARRLLSCCRGEWKLRV